MTESVPFLNPHVSDLAPRFAKLLPPLVTRGRHAAGRFLPESTGDLTGAVEALAVDTLRALTDDGEDRLPSRGWTESLARATGARVILGRRSLLRSGPRGAQAFERAILVAMLWDLRRALLGRADLPPRTTWQDGLPFTIAESETGSGVLFLAARASDRQVGDGLAIGMAHGGKEAALELFVPDTAQPESRVYALQIRRTL